MTKGQFRKFLFFKLPIAWIAGLRLKSLSETQAEITVKYGKFSQNPFRSIFWAVQGMAAELSTGVLCVKLLQQKKEKVSMLVLEQNGKFTKKAVGKITFTCTQGHEIKSIIEEAIASDEGKTIKVISKGTDEAGDIVAEFWFLWTFKKK